MKTLKKPLKLTANPLGIELLGGPMDGEVMNIPFEKQHIMVEHPYGKTRYSDTGALTNGGRIIYRCSSGACGGGPISNGLAMF